MRCSAKRAARVRSLRSLTASLLVTAVIESGHIQREHDHAGMIVTEISISTWVKPRV